MKALISNILILLGMLLLDTYNIEPLLARDNVITIYCNKKIGEVNDKVFGNNFIAYDPATYENFNGEYYGYSDYGAGIWDPKTKMPVKEVMDLAKESGMSIIRFPGGCGTHRYEWERAIGDERGHFLYGIDEFLKTCEEIGAEAVITLSYFNDCEHEAADMAEYLTSPDNGVNPNGGIDWAKERARNGHSSPYSNVKYFEIGNEVWHGDHRSIQAVSPEEYGRRYLKYYEAIKTVNPDIKIGVTLYENDWDQKVLGLIKDKLDFGIVHVYPSPQVSMPNLQLMNAKDIFKASLGVSIFESEAYFHKVSELLKNVSGKDIPLAVTEYNGGFVQDEPVPYRHCLGTALINAELLRIFMKPENNIIMANYWQFCNSYWGMVWTQEDYMKHDYKQHIKYLKRPNQYVYELYNKHFGPELIPAEVSCGSYRMKGFSVPYLSVNASKDTDKSKVYIVVINKNMEKPEKAVVSLKDFSSSLKGDAWVLSGLSVDAVNEKDPENVKVTHRDISLQGDSFEFIFEPHSLTAIEIERRP
jgi:alpha-N-arabinofuranosidase